MGEAGDEAVLNEFFAAVTPTIEELVTQALRMGQRVGQLAVVLERKFDGEIAGGCMSRAAVDLHLHRVEGVDADARARIAAAVRGMEELPVVLLVWGEGVISVGIRAVPGRLGSLS